MKNAGQGRELLGAGSIGARGHHDELVLRERHVVEEGEDGSRTWSHSRSALTSPRRLISDKRSVSWT